jgi:hypothetical protein
MQGQKNHPLGCSELLFGTLVRPGVSERLDFYR